MVEGQGFRDMMTYLEPGYTIPNRKQFTALIQHKHNLTKEELKLKMKEKAIGMSLTTDIWTSVAVEAYMTVTVHYINPDWILESLVFGDFLFSTETHWYHIAEKLQELAQRWEISEKVVSIIHDEAANMELAMEILEKEANWRSFSCLCTSSSAMLKGWCECQQY